MINKETKETSLLRLKKIEGQVRGIQQMVKNEKYCIEIINQINATRRALEQVALLVMKRHLTSCVTDAIKSEKGEDKISELIESMDKFIR